MRPLSNDDLRDIADYLVGTQANLRVTLSVLGFDPNEYPEIRKWLRELNLVRTKHLWKYKP